MLPLVVGLIGRFVYCLLRSRPVSRRTCIGASLSLLGLVGYFAQVFYFSSYEFNPFFETTDLVGSYEKGRYALELRADGTYTASGFKGRPSGEWTHHDFNLFFSGLELDRPRVIRRGGTLCIAPFYAGVDAHHGVLLRPEG